MSVGVIIILISTQQYLESTLFLKKYDGWRHVLSSISSSIIPYAHTGEEEKKRWTLKGEISRSAV